MGLDIFLVKYLGKDDEGYLKASTVKHPKWNDYRVSIRHQISDYVPMLELSSGKYGDWTAYYRPIDFDKAYEWADSLENPSERHYVRNMMEILQEDENYYLEYSR